MFISKIMTKTRSIKNHLINEVKSNYYKHFYKGAIVHREGFQIKLHRNEYISEYIFLKNRLYGSRERTILESAAAQCKSFIDCGANIGAISVPIVSKFRKPALCIEPVGANFRLLRENLRLNNLDDVAKPLQVALGDRPGTLKIFLSQSNSGDHRLSQADDEDRLMEEVTVKTLDSCIAADERLKPPYLIKIDTQGYECKILLGASETLRQPCVIVSEFWPWGLMVAGSNPEEFHRIVTNASLSALEISINSQGKVTLKKGDLLAIAARLSGKKHTTVVLTNIPLEQAGLQDILDTNS